MKASKRQLAVFLVVLSALVGALIFAGAQPTEIDHADSYRYSTSLFGSTMNYY